LRPAAAIELEKLTAELHALVRRIETVDARLRKPPPKPAREKQPRYAARLKLDDDDDAVAAVAEARTQYAKWLRGGRKPWPVRAYCVAKVLAGLPAPPKPLPAKQVTHSDVIRVGQQLGRLAREGRIVLVSRSGSKGYEPVGEADAA
jgi:hypothetical protein